MLFRSNFPMPPKRTSNEINKYALAVLLLASLPGRVVFAEMTADSFTDGKYTAALQVEQREGQTRYTLTTDAPLRDNKPADKRRTFAERADFPRIRTGTAMFDALYAMALDDAALNAVSEIRDGSFDVRPSMNHPYFQTGEMWTYVWTRDIAYATDLGLASLDPQRCRDSLLFKTTRLKPGISGQYTRQIVQDTGSGGSYPVSTDRVVWAFGAWEVLKYLHGDQRMRFVDDCWDVITNTIEHDRRVIFDPSDGLYRGEQSFLDWREQTYPGWTKDDVAAIAQSKALSTNVAYYQLLRIASKLASVKRFSEQEARYAKWADDLKEAVNREFYIKSKGLYSSLILDRYAKIRLNRFDLLGQSLAILTGVADEGTARRAVSNYPQSQYGPPVVWPQEQTVPIYHNHAIWPFVTAYWLKAARQTGSSAAIDHAAHSLIRGAALNLSNMENFDFISGSAYSEVNGISGPVINSRRQLWSVAGYISFVQDIVFGLETNWDGIRFLPCITAGMHREYFGGAETIVLDKFRYHDKVLRVAVHLPDADPEGSAIYQVKTIALNGSRIEAEFIPDDHLVKENHWEVWLDKADTKPDSINVLREATRRRIFGPRQPQLRAEGISENNETRKLRFDAGTETDVRFNVYRDGLLCGEMINATEWTDQNPADFPAQTHVYAVEAVYSNSGNSSHLSEIRWLAAKDDVVEINAASMKNVGGNLVSNHHFENWGQPVHQLEMTVRVKKSGTYKVTAEYSNGAGPINTGITCAVKRVEICEAGGALVASSYLVMPHTADWTRYLDSSSFAVGLESGRTYLIKIFEDTYSRNMSYFDHYEPYRGAGNGSLPYNYVNISKIKLLRLAK